MAKAGPQLSLADLEQVAGLARIVLEHAGVDRPPVPSSVIHFIDPHRPVFVAVEPLSRHTRGATLLSSDGAEWRVVLNANDPPEERRITLGHELYHIACGTGIAFRRDGQADFYECALAEEFALRLFIPDAWLSRLDRPTPEKVARRCLVTWRAARLRLASKSGS